MAQTIIDLLVVINGKYKIYVPALFNQKKKY